MPEILLGLAVLAGILLLLWLFVTTNPSTLARAVRYAGIVLLVIAAGFFVYLRFVVVAIIALAIAWGLSTLEEISGQIDDRLDMFRSSGGGGVLARILARHRGHENRKGRDSLLDKSRRYNRLGWKLNLITTAARWR